MQKAKKRKIFLCLFLAITVFCVFSSTITVSASYFKKDKIPIPEVKKDVYVYDEDNIIEDNIESKINTLLIQLEQKTTAEIVVITVDSLLSKEIEDYSYELANTLGIGKAEEDNGVLLLISRSDTKVRLEIGKGLEGCLNDSKCGRILDNYFVPYRDNNEYSEATYKTIEAIVSVVAQEYEIIIEDIDSSIATELEEQENASRITTFITVIVILVIIAIVIFCDNFFWGGVLLNFVSDVASSSGGSSRGGFGGGSFGGGGASR